MVEISQDAHVPGMSSSFADACAREPIHIPGSIQPHGFLLVIDEEQSRIVQASVNAEGLLGRPIADILGARLTDLLPDIAEAIAGDGLADDSSRGAAPTSPQGLGRVDCNGHSFEALVHRQGDRLLVELEETDPEAATGTLDALYPRIRAFVEDSQSLPTLDALNAQAARVVRDLTGFDRVLVYRFDPQWNGTVIAEDRNDRLPSYLDLRFPAADIPAQARELYRLNRLRIIPDAAYKPVPLVPEQDPSTGAATDLSFSALRSVSPVHVEYMRNMGTPASMSISIVEDGRLWGLISCHNATPRRVPAHVRTACDFLGQVVAMQIGARLRSDETAQRVARHTIESRLLAHMSNEPHYAVGLTRSPADLLALTDAAGAAVIGPDIMERVGETPSEDAIQEIADWLFRTQSHDDVFATDHLAADVPRAGALAETASGLMAISVSQLHPSYVLWFRPELVQTVRWGGDPRKTATDRLNPRQSFELWKETVHQRSAPWTPAQKAAGASLRNAIVGIVMRKAEEMAGLTEELKRSNRELEAFSYSISHDLRAPFRHIVGFGELLKESPSLAGDERAGRYVDTIIDAAISAGRLVDDLLGFSQMGRSKLVPIPVDMNRLVAEVMRMLRPELVDRQITFDVAPLPAATADPTFLRAVWQNLIGNAIKYSRKTDPTRITIGAESGENEDVYFVRDDGVGFDMDYVDKLFGVFQRLHRIEDYEGSGIGLANVRRVIDRHGGRTWAHGAPGQGATFYFSLPRRLEQN
ncbi:ATP-binding protein [Aureimonas frigidaquae]|uniref:histidine kinase n=1 Tax=Aureimonas frigidaquae TaxID=424757 RepID=A0A0P0YZS8_9HYPH|nr:ATP-binding protein [Aureimonas frigidaquae]BAT27215.1 bacteriophytochrome [Aureimonas frigidaquae]